MLQLNDINVVDFCCSVKECIEKGKGKGRNTIIVGGPNRAKSFMLLPPMLHIFKCFMCPSDGTFNWVGAHESELLIFNDVRYGGNGEADEKFVASLTSKIFLMI